MDAQPKDQAFALRFRADAFEAAAVKIERDGGISGQAERLRTAAAYLRRQAFRIEETGR